MKKDSSISKRPKGRGDNPKRKAKVVEHQKWCFKPSLKNEAVVLHSILDTYSVEYYSTMVSDIKNLITTLIREHGFLHGPERYNVIKNYTISLIEFREPENPGWLATSESYGIPSKLGETFIQLIVDYFESPDAALRPKYYQVILTTLNISRVIEGLTPADLGSVVEKAKPINVELLQSFETYVSERLQPYKFVPNSINLTGYRFHLNKNGPNRKPKIETALQEACCLLKSNLNQPFKHVCDELGVNYLYDYLLALSEYSLSATNDQEGISTGGVVLRKLVSVADPGFKTRIVAIVDFWTQLILEPIRSHVQYVTSELFSKTDFRMNQDDGVAAMVDFQRQCLHEEVVQGHKLNICSLKFYDISSWTDRFHRDLQKVVMKHLFSPRLSEKWAQLVVHCSWDVGGQGRTVKYGQGQGMGTNGSFDIATLTDHLLINFVYDRLSTISGIFPDNRCYGKVGDDLWIYDPDDLLKDIYEQINLPINLSKSKEHTKLGSIAEFCSRTFLDTIDVSRISPKIINKSRNFRYIPTLLNLCCHRGVRLDASSFEYLNNNVKESEYTYFDKLQPWIIGLCCLGYLEPCSKSSNLTLDYLTEGHWVSEETLQFLESPDLMARLAINHYIVEIAESLNDVKSKMLEISEVTGTKKWNDLDTLQGKDLNLFDLNSAAHKAGKGFFGTDHVLLPREIILLERYNDQYHSIMSNVPYGMLKLPDDVTRLDQAAKALHQISVRSCYDRGNINYDQKRVYNTQFRMVKTLESSSEDLTILYLSDPEIIEATETILFKQLINQEWGEELPLLCKEPRPNRLSLEID